MTVSDAEAGEGVPHRLHTRQLEANGTHRRLVTAHLETLCCKPLLELRLSGQYLATRALYPPTALAAQPSPSPNEGRLESLAFPPWCGAFAFPGPNIIYTGSFDQRLPVLRRQTIGNPIFEKIENTDHISSPNLSRNFGRISFRLTTQEAIEDESNDFDPAWCPVFMCQVRRGSNCN